MAGIASSRTPPQAEEGAPLSSILGPKEHDFASKKVGIRTDSTNMHEERDHTEAASVSDTTATNSSDEFDWDEEDEEPTAPDEWEDKRKARRGRALWLALMKLSQPFRVFVVGALGAGILITPLLVVEFKFKSSVVRQHVHAWSLWLSIIWAAGCATYLVVDYVPRIFIYILTLFGTQVERLRMQIELFLAVSAWIKLLLDISWAWIALGVIRTTYNPPGSYWVVINRVMQVIFAAGCVFLAAKLFLRFVAINFHRKALAERLAENRLGLKALDRLSNAQPATFKRTAYGKRGHKSPTQGNSRPNSRRNSLDLLGFHGHRASQKSNQDTQGSPSASVSPVNEKGSDHNHANEKVKNDGRHDKSKSGENKRRRRKFMASVIVDQLSGALGQVALKNSKLNRDVGSLYSARRLARKLFRALSDADPPRDHLVVEDFYPYFSTTAEAQAAFAIFDKDGNGDISKREMREAVQRIYRERKALVSSLKDVGSIVAKLDAVCIVIALVIIFFIALLVLNRKDTVTSLVPLATIILGLSFIFGHSAQLLFESLIFIFSTHVFDVGDLVMIDDQPLFVREFGLFSTTFRRVDGQEIIAPNALLSSTKLVHNLRRSNAMWETTNLMVSYDTPLEALEQLRQRINSYVADHSREWSNCGVHIDKMEFQNAITLIIAMEHRPNWQDWGGRWGRRTEFMRHLKTVLEELDVRYSLPVQPVLLPKQSPFGNSAPSLRARQSSGAMASRETLGNAGSFQGSDFMLRAPTRSIRTNTPDRI